MLITLSQAQAILSSPIFGLKLPVAISFQLARLAKALSGEMQTYEAERQKLIKTCGGVLSEDKTHYDFGADTAPAFQIGMADLLNATVEIGAAWPMDLAKLGAVELSPAELMQLDPLFTVAE